MKFLLNMVSNLQKAIERQQIAKVRVMFMDMSDRQLQDVGISRELLEQGVGAYPWRNASEPEVVQSEMAEVVTLPQVREQKVKVDPSPRLAA